MNEIKSLQERIEIRVLNDLSNQLANAAFMARNVTLDDMSNFIKKISSEEKDTNKYFRKTLDKLEDIYASSGGYFSQLRQVMIERMFPAALEKKLKNIDEKIDLISKQD